MTKANLQRGDFTPLAGNYSKFRPSYSTTVRDALLAMVGKSPGQIEAADVGAGTGIWSRMLAAMVKHVVAVEPNEEMRRFGTQDCSGLNIEYRNGSGEDTGLTSHSVDLLSMASSFHWVDFDKGTAEFHRIIRPGGRFVALWNPRNIELNPLLLEIEAEITRLKPDIKRVSSGASGITETLSERLLATGRFDDIVYTEGSHTVEQTCDQYLGVWRSVNDVRRQLGPELWETFMATVEKRISGLDGIVTTYKTRAWSARSC